MILQTHFVSKIKHLISQFFRPHMLRISRKEMAPVKNISDGSGAHTSTCPGCD